jgi:ATPase family associated with various cellular activities (AAA)
MLITLPMSLVDKAIKETKSEVLAQAKASTKFVRKLEIEGSLIDKPTLKFLVSEAKEKSTPYAHNLEFLYALSRNKIKAEFRSLVDCTEAIKIYFNQDKIKGYLFSRENDGVIYPWLVTSLGDSVKNDYGHRNLATDSKNTRFTLNGSKATSNEVQTRNIGISAFTIKGFLNSKELEYKEKYVTRDNYDYLVDCTAEEPIKVQEFFEYLNLYKETPALFEIYEKHLERFKAFLPRYGHQFVVRGFTEIESDDWWVRNSTLDLSVDNSPGRAIMTTVPTACTMESEVQTSGSRSRLGYRKKARSTSDENSFLTNVDDLDIPLKELEISDIEIHLRGKVDNAEVDLAAPLHPILSIFHLAHHQVFEVHVANMAPYKYKDNIKDQLILPEEMKVLSEMLVAVGEEDSEDVIENKSQATIIACIGDPGLGKTLLAEVISEECKKPLYKIQAAQLGMTHEDLEINLSRILKRAEAWDCVLMIDEANAYVHERGHDIRQNAIVGVFLRLLEYFKGTMILTTNHSGVDGGIDIDDAIVSRCSAVFEFHLPTDEDAVKIWKLQSKLLKIKISDNLIDSLVNKYKISGRSIRNLLRLTSRYAKRTEAETLSFKMFDTCAKYIPTTQSEITETK